MIIKESTHLRYDGDEAIEYQRSSKKNKQSKKGSRFYTSRDSSDKTATLARQKFRDSKYFLKNRFATETNDYTTILCKKPVFSAF